VPRAHVALVLALAVCAAATARGELVRGAIKVDVRDGAGNPASAEVSVRGPDGAAAVARSGDIYVASGLVDGEWIVDVAGAGERRVQLRGRQDVGVVFVLGAAARGKRGFDPNLVPGEHACDASDGVLVEAVGFARGGGLGAGRVDVSAKGRLYCSAVLAGGAASLHLPPGDYDIAARFVGGGAARERYRVRRDETPTPLVLRAKP
jgi:hypothetical protein